MVMARGRIPPKDEDVLQASLAALSRLSTGRLNLEDLLVRVATVAVWAIPGADGAGVTMLEHDRADPIVASAPFVSEIDAIQSRPGVRAGLCGGVDGRIRRRAPRRCPGWPGVRMRCNARRAVCCHRDR